MATNNIAIRVGLRQWLRYYLYGVLLMCWLTKQAPDTDKLDYWIAKGTKIWIS